MHREVEKPQILIAIDNSESMMMNKDSLELRTAIRENIDKLKSVLTEKFDVQEMKFGANPSLDADLDFSERRSDLSKVIRESQHIMNSSLAKGVVLVSDGIFNSGRHPAYSALKSKIPVYTIATGDTSIRRDIRVQAVRTNSISFLGNEFPIEIDVSANKARGTNASLTIWGNGKRLVQQTISINSDKFTQSYSFQLKAEQVGTSNFRVGVSYIEGELNTLNNTNYASTEVIDGKQRILINCHAPHPDIAALKSVIESSDQYELEVRIGDLKSVNSGEFDLVITHAMPVQGGEVAYIKGLRERKIPHLAILGSKTNISQWNQIPEKMTIQGNRSNFNQVLPTWNKEFDYFELEDASKAFINNYPPLLVPFGQYQVTGEAGICLYQKIGSVVTQMPLVSFEKKDGLKNAVLTGEGIWRWRFYEFEQRGDNEVFNEFFKKVFQYLALKDDKRKFRVSSSRKTYFENDKISLRAEVYNENYELVNANSVQLELRSDDGEFKYAFLPKGDHYEISPGNLPVGNYSYTAKTTISGRVEAVRGTFSVRPLVLEALNLSANFNVMKQIAENSSGSFSTLDEMGALAQNLIENENSQSIVRSRASFKDVIDLRWLFALIFGLLAIEWIARRWAGSY